MTAVDENEPMLSSEVPVTVAIDDTNDQSPSFVFPAENNRTFPVSSGVPRGFPVVTVEAHDDDIGGNSRLSYDLAASDQQKPLFKINRFLHAGFNFSFK